MIPLIIDTDVALGVWHDGRPRDIDDGFAVIEAINEPTIDLIGITTVYGNAPIEDTTRVARELANLKQSDTPVVQGATNALAQDLTKDRAKPSSEEIAALEQNDAVEFLARCLKQQRLNIAAIGPLTNIGVLALKYPECMSHIDRLIIVAGRTPGRSFYIGDVGPVRDFNFENDVLAMQLILQSGVPVVLAGFELTSQVCITARDLEQIKSHGSATADYLYNNSLDWFRHWTHTFPSEPGFHPWDSATISWLREPQLFESDQRGWRICSATEEPGSENPDNSPSRNFHLECSSEFGGPQLTYVSGFNAMPDSREDTKQRFIDEICRLVY